MRDLPDLRVVVGGDGGREAELVACVNPAHDDTNPSMRVYDDHIHCYACGYHARGDVALMSLTGTSDPVAARARVDQAAYQTPVVRSTRIDVENDPMPRETAAWAAAILASSPERKVWLLERGLSDETIQREQLGYSTYAYVIPVWNRDRTKLLTLRYRLDPEYADPEMLLRSKYLGVKGRNEPIPYGTWWLDPKARWVVVCEGELDALRLHQEGYPAVAYTNGANILHGLLPRLRAGWKTIRHVVIATDQDEAGEAAACDLAEEAERLRWATRRVVWDRERYGKDVTEYLRSGGDPTVFAANPLEAREDPRYPATEAGG